VEIISFVLGPVVKHVCLVTGARQHGTKPKSTKDTLEIQGVTLIYSLHTYMRTLGLAVQCMWYLRSDMCALYYKATTDLQCTLKRSTLVMYNKCDNHITETIIITACDHLVHKYCLAMSISYTVFKIPAIFKFNFNYS